MNDNQSDVERIDRLRKLLEDQHSFPLDYNFKIIVSSDKSEEVEVQFKNENLLKKFSSKGRYISYGLIKKVNSSNEILDLYERAKKIEGAVVI